MKGLHMKVSLIIAVYKDIEALELIFDSLVHQSYTNFEVVVAEDGESNIVREFIIKAHNKYDFAIVHTTQEDNAVQKSKSQNQGIRASSGEYLIFIDGDCILYENFIKNHLSISGRKLIVAGRRVNLGPKYSQLLREGSITSRLIEKNFLFKYFDIQVDAKSERHTEEGFEIKPHGIIHVLLQKYRKKKVSLLGCNMSFYKDAILEINGFDEELGNSAMASDTDLEWRFKGLGYKIVSARFLANQYHLYHERSVNDYDRSLDIHMLENQKKKQYVCKKGIVPL